MKNKILQHLHSDFPWCEHLIYLDTVDSTNTYAKKLAANGAPHGTVVVAGMQTAGRGRMGRSFHSPQGSGIYLSVILRPSCPACELMHLTCAAGVVMCDAVEETTGLRPGIKWINDLVWNGKKLGGILTELSLNANGSVDHAIVGIGINCNHSTGDFPPELQEIATSLLIAGGKPVSLPRLTASMIRKLYSLSTDLSSKQEIMDRYRSNCVTLQKEVTVHTSQCEHTCYAYDIDNNGALLVRFSDGHTAVVSSGEASVRGICGYT